MSLRWEVVWIFDVVSFKSTYFKYTDFRYIFLSTPISKEEANRIPKQLKEENGGKIRSDHVIMGISKKDILNTMLLPGLIQSSREGRGEKEMAQDFSLTTGETPG